MPSSSIALAVAIAAAQAAPSAVSLQPSSATLTDTTTAGTVVASATVTNSDGSTASSCNLSSSNSLYKGNGCKIVTARDLTAADVGAHNAIISAEAMPQTSAPGTIVCAPGSAAAKYCTGGAAALQWHGHQFGFYQPATPGGEKGNFSLTLDGQPASCGGTVGEWSGFELAIDSGGQLYMQSFDNGSPGWSTYDDSGSDTCFQNYGETPPAL